MRQAERVANGGLDAQVSRFTAPEAGREAGVDNVENLVDDVGGDRLEGRHWLLPLNFGGDRLLARNSFFIGPFRRNRLWLGLDLFPFDNGIRADQFEPDAHGVMVVLDYVRIAKKIAPYLCTGL